MKKKKLTRWEIEVCFETNASKNNDKFMELLEDKFYDVIDEVSPESGEMSVLRINF